MNILSTLPQWLAVAIIAAVFATLGFFGRKLFDKIEERRSKKANAIKQLDKLKRLLNESRSVFKNQNYLAKRLISLLQSEHGNQTPTQIGYDETFCQMYDCMNGEQRELFNLIRGTTLNSMRRLNGELLQWASENTARQLVGRSSPNVESLDSQLNLLRRHLNEWFDKYESVFKTSARRSLVYLADEKKHGHRFPSELADTVDSLLVELDPSLLDSVLKQPRAELVEKFKLMGVNVLILDESDMESSSKREIDRLEAFQAVVFDEDIEEREQRR